jgi:predicted metalloendopeptidase
MQGGLGLPDREYYLSADPKMAELKNKYRVYVAQILTLAGRPDAQGAANRIVDLETKIAEGHATREESEDIAKGSQVWTRAELEKKAPGIDWGALLEAAQLGSVAEIRCLSSRMQFRSWPRWSDRNRFRRGRTGSNSTPSISSPTSFPRPSADASFALNGTALSGTPQQRPRDKLALNATEQRASGRGRQSLCRQIFPGLVQGRDPADGREFEGCLRHARASHRLDGGRRPRKRR